jgi:anti-sigma B factor antagonist
MADSPTFAVDVRLQPATNGRSGEVQVAVVTVVGELDLSTVPVLRQKLTEAICPACAAVVVDLAAVDFIDASGVGALVGAAGEASRAGVKFVLREPSTSVERMLDLAGLDGILEVEG